MDRRSQVLFILLVMAVVSVIIVCLTILPSWLVARDTDVQALTAEQRAKASSDARATLLQGVGGLVLALGAVAAWRQLSVAKEGQITERFTHAVDQLGNHELDVRLGGIYALERIARDSMADRSTIAEVLSAYVRARSPWHSSELEQSNDEASTKSVPFLRALFSYVCARSSEIGQSTDDVSIKSVPFLQERAPDVQAAVTVLGRFPGRAGERSINLRAADLRRANLKGADLERALFEVANLSGSQFLGANLRKANLYLAVLESADFGSADLRGASFTRAFLKNGFFWSARSQGAHFNGAHLVGARFDSADLRNANFRGAHLVGARFDAADLRNAEFRYAIMEDSHLEGADLRDADLSQAKLENASSDAETKWPPNFDWRAAGIRRL